MQHEPVINIIGQVEQLYPSKRRWKLLSLAQGREGIAWGYEEVEEE